MDSHTYTFGFALSSKRTIEKDFEDCPVSSRSPGSRLVAHCKSSRIRGGHRFACLRFGRSFNLGSHLLTSNNCREQAPLSLNDTIQEMSESFVRAGLPESGKTKILHRNPTLIRDLLYWRLSSSRCFSAVNLPHKPGCCRRQDKTNLQECAATNC